MKSLLRTINLSAAILSLCALSPLASAWDAVGHRAIAWLALDGLSPDTPAWIKDKAKTHAIGWQASEPDRWRGIRSNYMAHENNPEHYLDLEDLAHFGLTLQTVPPLRYQYVTAMAVSRHEHPSGVDGKLKPHNPKLDPDGDSEWPGFLPHAIAEHYAKLTGSFRNYRILEKLNQSDRAPQLEMSKANIAVEMGILAHFVGDAAQPLHTTSHHHGWVTPEGDPWKNNPQGYTTDRGIHAYIDGGVIKLHHIDYHSLKPTQKYDTTVDPIDPWQDVLKHIQRSFDKMVPLYEMEKAKKFPEKEGKEFIEERLHDAAAMLAALYNAAWKASEPSQKDIEDFIRYDGFDIKQVP